MAISNYAELQSAVANYLHRSDLTAQIPDFISMAEAKLNRILRLRAMENVATGSVAASVALPDGFVEMISLTVNSGGFVYPVTYAVPSSLTADSGIAYRYTLIGDNIKFMPTGSGETYTLTYYKKFDPLSSGVNWLITNAPDVYLYATLLEAAPYIRDDARMQVWFDMMSKTIDLLKRADTSDRFGGDLMVRPS